MRDNHILAAIANRMPVTNNKLKLGLMLSGTYLVGLATAWALWVAMPSIGEDDLAKLAALASRSSGQPASVLWLDAKAKSPWSWQQTEIARHLLVDISVDRCAVRQAANSD